MKERHSLVYVLSLIEWVGLRLVKEELSMLNSNVGGVLLGRKKGIVRHICCQ